MAGICRLIPIPRNKFQQVAVLVLQTFDRGFKEIEAFIHERKRLFIDEIYEVMVFQKNAKKLILPWQQQG